VFDTTQTAQQWAGSSPNRIAITDIHLESARSLRPFTGVDPLYSATADSMLSHFGAWEIGFSYRSFAHDQSTGRTVYEPNSYVYRGTATQLNAAAVPEPATLMMMGLGLASFAASGIRAKTLSRQ
jgi:PEP-CTERM motif